MINKNYINLTNGIEAIKEYQLNDYSFIRICSTHCEQKLWDRVLLELDNDLLMNLAIGNKCFVYDYSQKRNTPRSIWQGLSFIRYVLNRVWFNRKINAVVKNLNVDRYFEECYKNLTNKTINKIKYYRRFLNTDYLELISITKQTDNDGNYNHYKNILLND